MTDPEAPDTDTWENEGGAPAPEPYEPPQSPTPDP
jgi:hypothetical protein